MGKDIEESKRAYLAPWLRELMRDSQSERQARRIDLEWVEDERAEGILRPRFKPRDRG